MDSSKRDFIKLGLGGVITAVGAGIGSPATAQTAAPQRSTGRIRAVDVRRRRCLAVGNGLHQEREFDFVYFVADPSFRALHDNSRFRDLAASLLNEEQKELSEVKLK